MMSRAVENGCFAVIVLSIVVLLAMMTTCTCTPEDDSLSRYAGSTVLDKSFTPAHTYYTTHMVGKVPTRRRVHVQDQWRIKLRRADNKTTWIYVSEEEYNALEEGDVYPKQETP